MKEGGFRPGGKERGSYGCAVQSGKSEEEEVMGDGTGESRIEELVPE